MRIIETLDIIANALAAGPEEKRIPVGGQAVIEGVLMKGPEHWGLAVREPSGGIWLKAWLGSEWLKHGAWKWPIIRGFATMVEMMRIGMKALSKSAEISLGEEEKITPLEMVGSVAIAIVAVVGLFVALPMFVSEYFTKLWGFSHLGKNIMEGVMRGLVFIGYVAVIGLWKDIQRVFMYHGAEHKTINAWEQGAELTPESVSHYSRIHRRCGTSFLRVVVAVSILVFGVAGSGHPVWRFASRIVLLPVVVGLSYEIIRWASRDHLLGRWLMAPALLLQYLTTREPSADQVEVAIDALRVALEPPLPETPNP